MRLRIATYFAAAAALALLARWLDLRERGPAEYLAWASALQAELDGVPTAGVDRLARVEAAQAAPLEEARLFQLSVLGGSAEVEAALFQRHTLEPGGVGRAALAIEGDVPAHAVAESLEALAKDGFGEVALLFRGPTPPPPTEPSGAVRPLLRLRDDRVREAGFWHEFQSLEKECGFEEPIGHINPFDLPVVVDQWVAEMAASCRQARSQETRLLIWFGKTHVFVRGARHVLIRLAEPGHGRLVEARALEPWWQVAPRLVRAAAEGPIELRCD